MFRHPALKKMPLLVLCNKSDGQTQPTENPVHADAEAPAPAPAPADSSSESDDEGKKDEKEAPKTDEPPATPRSSQILTADPGPRRAATHALSSATERLDVRVIETTVDDGQGHRRLAGVGERGLTDRAQDVVGSRRLFLLRSSGSLARDRRCCDRRPWCAERACDDGGSKPVTAPSTDPVRRQGLIQPQKQHERVHLARRSAAMAWCQVPSRPKDASPAPSRTRGGRSAGRPRPIQPTALERLVRFHAEDHGSVHVRPVDVLLQLRLVRSGPVP